MQFQNNYPLKNVTTLGIGGPAKKFVGVKSQDELIEALKYAKREDLSYLLIGGGSNLLIADEGFEGLVIKNEITGLSHPGGVTLKVKSGTRLQDLVDYAVQNRCSGMQKLTGIPGTVGGAIRGNAGAYGQTISDHLIKVTILNPDNLTAEQYNNSDCNFGYRNSIFKRNRYIVLDAEFKLETGDPETLQNEIKEVTWKRFVKYPPGLKCPGSFFKNLIVSDLPTEILQKIPKEKIIYGKIPAATLLEEVGAKGQSFDGIKITDYHANLFINQGTGTAKTLYDLAKTYAFKVKEKFGITLEPEVQLINLPPLI